ncbi:hypothetical protein [Microbispora sp. NPDC049125]|uniref:hypothetical protein n=1 Tax=Microbispora sp. NPDC049125 TaxID=3154929 RepID=UPI0034672FB0
MRAKSLGRTIAVLGAVLATSTGVVQSAAQPASAAGVRSLQGGGGCPSSIYIHDDAGGSGFATVTSGPGQPTTYQKYIPDTATYLTFSTLCPAGFTSEFYTGSTTITPGSGTLVINWNCYKHYIYYPYGYENVCVAV